MSSTISVWQNKHLKRHSDSLCEEESLSDSDRFAKNESRFFSISSRAFCVDAFTAIFCAAFSSAFSAVSSESNEGKQDRKR